MHWCAVKCSFFIDCLLLYYRDLGVFCYIILHDLFIVTYLSSLSPDVDITVITILFSLSFFLSWALTSLLLTLLSDHQYGFRKGRSWTNAIDEGDRIDVAYFDFRNIRKHSNNESSEETLDEPRSYVTLKMQTTGIDQVQIKRVLHRLQLSNQAEE